MNSLQYIACYLQRIRIDCSLIIDASICGQPRNRDTDGQSDSPVRLDDCVSETDNLPFSAFALPFAEGEYVREELDANCICEISQVDPISHTPCTVAEGRYGTCSK